jgi:hypothetical protein
MSVSDSGDLDSLWSFGKAQSKYYLSSRSDYVDEASGKKMMMSFATDGNVDNVKIWGNAKSKYHIDEDKSSGTNEASGDSITVKFHKGKATQLTLTGRSRGKYYPRDL